MAKVIVAEASGKILDWLVGLCAGYELRLYGVTPSILAMVPGQGVIAPWRPTYYWNQGGPIIDREKIEMIPPADKDDREWMAVWYKCDDAEAGIQVGPTPLIAAMRCYVASKLGDIVEVPENLL